MARMVSLTHVEVDFPAFSASRSIMSRSPFVSLIRNGRSLLRSSEIGLRPIVENLRKLWLHYIDSGFNCGYTMNGSQEEPRTGAETMTLESLKSLGVNVGMLTRHASLAEARSAAYGFRANASPRLIIMGSDDRYWVVSARDAGILRKAGFETI